MRSYGSLVQSDFAAQYLAHVREPWSRRGNLDVLRAPRKEGDDKLTGHMLTPAECDKRRAFSLYDRCKARYGLCP
jgi:hypothetical protein